MIKIITVVIIVTLRGVTIMAVRQTSLYAYEIITNDGTKRSQKEKILNLLQMNPDGLTREEIRDISGIMYSSVCGRINALIKEGKAYENEQHKRINNSGKIAYVVKCYG